MGRRHAEVLARQIPNAELVAIVDANPAAAEAAAAALGIDRWTSDPDAVMADPAIDAVVIASSTDTHAPLIIAAAQAGKDIFCEKPIALDLEATDAALDAVDSGRRPPPGRLPAPLRQGVRQSEGDDRRGRARPDRIHPRRDARSRTGLPGVPRHLRRALPRHDDPQLRQRPLADGRRGRRGLRDGHGPRSIRCSPSWTTSTPASSPSASPTAAWPASTTAAAPGSATMSAPRSSAPKGALMVGYSRDTPSFTLEAGRPERPRPLVPRSLRRGLRRRARSTSSMRSSNDTARCGHRRRRPRGPGAGLRRGASLHEHRPVRLQEIRPRVTHGEPRDQPAHSLGRDGGRRQATSFASRRRPPGGSTPAST